MRNKIELLSTDEIEKSDHANWLDRNMFDLLVEPRLVDQPNQDEYGQCLRAANSLTNGGFDTVRMLLTDRSWIDASRVQKLRGFGPGSARTVLLALQRIGLSKEQNPWKCWAQGTVTHECTNALTDFPSSDPDPECGREMHEGLTELALFLLDENNARALEYMMRKLPKGG